MGNESDFTAYELVVAKSEKDAVGASGSARVFDATVNPELGFYIVPQEMGAFEVSFTISDDLEPFRPSDDNRYYAQLRTHDVAGCVHVTSVAQATTKLAPFNWIPIFDEVLDYELFGSPLTLEPGCGIDGSKCLRCRALSCLDVPDPWDNMKLTGSIDLSTVSDNAITSGQAYLELSVAVVSDTPVFYSEVALTRGPTDSQASWKVERVHIRAAGTPNYQTMQFPLNSMLHQNQGFTHADLATPLTQFRLGAEFINATDVYLDHIGVGW
jgi:hypothetical protein